ncbi:acyltransferase domain-containing protein, partial [Murinocardiopsis flavida]|uniref:acyltransferase domain-containing protein n=1 Tax=Murinocardiopsis flavida TaxID=645275 RepID=UPI0011B2787B
RDGSGDGGDPGSLVPVILSHASGPGLRSTAARWATHLRTHPHTPLPDIAHTATTRARLDHRTIALAHTTPDLATLLDHLAEGTPPPRLLHGRPTPGHTALLFTGQGAQHPGMGHHLAHHHPAFAHAWNQARTRLDHHLPHPLTTIAWAPPDTPEAALLHDTLYAQAALFAYETALARLAQAAGLRPDYLAGHSIGEISAAHIAGVLTLDDACALVAARGRLMQALPAGGAMAAITTTPEAARAYTEHTGLDLAAVNSPTSIVLSGPETAIEQAVTHFRGQGCRTRRLRVSHAFHSALIDPMLEQFAQVAAGLDYHPPTIPVVSNLTGTLAGPEIATPDYWVRHARQPVLFAQCMDYLTAAGVNTFIEAGPDAALSAAGPECVPPGSTAVFAPLGRRGHHEHHTLLHGLATAHLHGTPLTLTHLTPSTDTTSDTTPTGTSTSVSSSDTASASAGTTGTSASSSDSSTATASASGTNTVTGSGGSDIADAASGTSADTASASESANTDSSTA